MVRRGGLAGWLSFSQRNWRFFARRRSWNGAATVRVREVSSVVPHDEGVPAWCWTMQLCEPAARAWWWQRCMENMCRWTHSHIYIYILIYDYIMFILSTIYV